MRWNCGKWRTPLASASRARKRWRSGLAGGACSALSVRHRRVGNDGGAGGRRRGAARNIDGGDPLQGSDLLASNGAFHAELVRLMAA
jgi:hypothetical protein